jgi:hypothetical protein
MTGFDPMPFDAKIGVRLSERKCRMAKVSMTGGYRRLPDAVR